MTTRSEELLARALKTIPWGTQTNAKRPVPALAGVMPAFIERGDGCRIQDVDGSWFIDYRMALGPIILGYCHPLVDAAVRAQMQKGVLFSMASPLEIEVAEALTGSIAGFEQVHFMKTGHEANQAALRLARAFTGRDRIATCCYHGHSDWFSCGVGAPIDLPPRDGNGVPGVLDDLVTRLPYGDITRAREMFARHGDQLAAVMMVPYDWREDVAHDFVRFIREETRRCGAVLIFDQVLTGFRIAHGGAQEFFGVIPDLSTYGKALANGYPLSCFGGRRDVMQTLERVILTTTHAGETLSLAAAAATLKVMQEEDVVGHLFEMGERLRSGLLHAAKRTGAALEVYGLSPVLRLRFSRDPARDRALRMIFHRELLERGVFPGNPLMLSYAHKVEHIDQTLAAADEALRIIAREEATR